jgi:GH15 family glucan-1,4-alpha-glucosidase
VRTRHGSLAHASAAARKGFHHDRRLHRIGRPNGSVRPDLFCLAPVAPIDAQKALVDAEKFWRHWISRCTSAGKWSADVRRSLITLKALTYRPTGGIVAAPTTSLPEQLGGPRNWDYRFCWLRDATFTLLALMNSGYYEEARSWQAWLLRAVAGQPSQVQIMYGLLGERRLTEWEIPWLPGYEGSKPVRIGNAAATQLQLDIFGEVMDAFYQGRNGKLVVEEHAWAVQRALLDHLETVWDSRMKESGKFAAVVNNTLIQR